ncbi:Auxin transporter-like protein 2 [Sesamum angolense]|uniref:Auxin transporter-like protein 2 n=1 Tax=Sesamum angolense TaxID=2727404 RepID=A0AAE1WMR0_9LAMI|nr:Auxin transporter-like protein 2 [Sesamum angolense]
MLAQKQAEEAIVSNFNETEHDGGGKEEEKVEEHSMFSVKSMLWHGGSAWDAWFSCASNQVAQVLLTLHTPFLNWECCLESFFKYSTVWLAAGPLILSVFYTSSIELARKKKVSASRTMSFSGLKCWMDYWSILESSGSGLQLHVPSLRICHPTHSLRQNLVLFRTRDDHLHAWYLTIAALLHGQVEDVQHSGPKKLVLYFTGATNILYTFGGHAVTVEIMHAMWKPQKFKYIYLLATLYVFTLTLPSASAVYWAFGDQLLNHANAFSLLPKNSWRDAAVILMLIHQHMFEGAGEAAGGDTDMVLGHHLPILWAYQLRGWGTLVSFTVYIIPALAHMLTYRKASARQNAAEKPPAFMPSWAAMYAINTFVVIWVLVVGFGFGGWASVTNFVRQVDTFGLFAKCYQSSSSSFTSPRKSSRLLDLMREGSTSLRRLFDMEHTSLGNYFKDYTVSPIIKPVLLWGSDSDTGVHDDPWAELKIIRGSFDSRNGHQNGILSSQGSFNDEGHMQHGISLITRRRKLIRTKSYKSLPRFSFWRCGVGFKFRLRLIRRLRIMIRGKKL